MSKFYRKLFSQAEIQNILGHAVLKAHRVNVDDGTKFKITLLTVPDPEGGNNWGVRAEVSEVIEPLDDTA